MSVYVTLMCSKDINFLIWILFLIEQIVQMAGLDLCVIKIAIVWMTQRFVTKMMDIALQDVRPDGKEAVVKKVRQ